MLGVLAAVAYAALLWKASVAEVQRVERVVEAKPANRDPADR